MLALLFAAAISAANIKSHIDFLASDLLEGRETGSRGFDIGAQYVATRFAALGLDAAGDRGTYFQRIEFTSAQMDEERSSMAINSGTAMATGPFVRTPRAMASQAIAVHLRLSFRA